MKKIAYFFVLVLLITGCDVIEEPIIPFNINYNADAYGPAPTFSAPVNTSRNALVEDFTAHQCGNCPPAAVIATSIQTSNPEGRVSVVAVHAGSLAVTNSDYPTDWTTADGDIFWNQLGFQANPLGRVNRKNGVENFYAPDQWADAAADILAQDGIVNLQMIANYIQEDNVLNVHVNGQFAGAFNGTTKLTVLITESHIFDNQLDYGSDPEHIEDYEFNHTLRGSISGALGLVFSENANTGDEIQKNFTFQWNDEWVPENCSAVAFVSDDSDGEILNVVEHHLGE
jgi:hypothetical protein